MVWVGIDDTDGPSGGCTTWVLTELVRVARGLGLELTAEPRLVRLNPNIPWKTRGNAALAARFGPGGRIRRTIGAIDGEPVVLRSPGPRADAAPEAEFVRRAWERVEALAARERGTDPALVAARRPLPAPMYWSAVREVVDLERRIRELDAAGATVRYRGEPTGLVGASAAIAWPGRRPTWEAIAYRSAERWGRPRSLDPESVRGVARDDPDLFLCDDPRTRRLLVAPHTPCPILFGLRSRRPEGLPEAVARVRSEPVERWLVFRTNQGSGDHLIRRPAGGYAAYLSGETVGTVRGSPSALPGGHHRFEIVDDGGVGLTCLAYEPTKTLPRIVAGLAEGDRVRVWGSVGLRAGLRLEGLELLRLAPRPQLEKPRCRRCARPARSLGSARGYRCRECGRRWPPEKVRRRPTVRSVRRGTYHPTPSARRHLAPLAPEP
jgi:tRNA(Ile2)-agmatinylcytidine synthase